MISLGVSRARAVRLLLASAAVAGLVGLGGCQVEDMQQISAKHLQPIPSETVALMEKKGMSKNAPILVRVFKEESELEVWKEDSSGQFALLKTYPICRWSGELGPKIQQGDRQAPEGFYAINPRQMNPNSSYYLSFNMGYPNAYDRAHGRTGAHLMVHGNCSSAGCYSMTDEQIGEIFAIGRESFFGGQKSFQVQAYPFRMTALNMAKHRNSPHFAFWKMLKEGNDHFEVTRQQPTVEVCEKRYVFNPGQPANMSTPLKFDAAGRCPAFEVPPEVKAEVVAKAKRDEAQFASLVSRGTATVPVKTGQDGGMHPTFLAKLNPQQVRDDKGNVRWLVDNPPVGTVAALTPWSSSRDPANEMVRPVAMAAAPASGPSADVPMPRPVPGRGSSVASFSSPGSTAVAYTASAAPSRPTGQSGSFFNELLFSPTETVKGAASSVGRVLGFGGGEAQPAAKSRPVIAARPHPKPVVAKREVPKREAEPAAPAAQITTVATATPRPAAAASLVSGAQPVVPSTGFENRWQALR